MDPRDTTLNMATPTPLHSEVPEELPADIDEPPETNHHINFWLPAKPPAHSPYAKAVPPAYMRRESLLTRQLHSETEHSDEEIISPLRGLSTGSVWSNPSTISTAELTSDDGHSMPSPGISPALPPTTSKNALLVSDKPLNEPKILGLESVITKDPVESGLGRKRCITFACGNKDKTPRPVTPPVEKEALLPKRRCALTFVCPSKPAQPVEKPEVATRPALSPSPKMRRSSSSIKQIKVHRGSDSTVNGMPSPRSPRLSRKSPLPEKQLSPKSTATVKPPVVDDSDSGREATRFHEFATSEDEPDEWTQESTCYRTRLCVNDTLKKENVIRQLAQEVEDEVLAEEDDEELEDELDDEPDNDDIDDIEEQDNEEDEASDDGFHSDDEEGFAGSDDDGEGSDNEWWTPAAISTAATSTDHLDLTRISAQPQPTSYASSLASMSSMNTRNHRPRPFRTHSKSAALNIERPTTPDLPDSTDFVCGTLDEDRPKEQAYIDRMKEREAAKHRPTPQDIDPTFPTSDPEMDEEDDEDIEDPQVSSAEEIMHGSLDSIHGTARRISPARRASIRQRSPAPAAIRKKSPAPAAIRHRSPAPTAVRHRSPAPVARAKSPAPKPRAKSPAPKPRRRSPAPPARARSPAPKKLFGTSPRRPRSPTPAISYTSPPNTRRTSPTELFPTATGLAGRPNTLTVASSLPKRASYMSTRLAQQPSDVEGEQTPTVHSRRRGAIDIVKGLEKKKQRRREKLCQKLAAKKAAANGEERKKVKPGRGAERMREVGLELQKYKGRAGHILSY